MKLKLLSVASVIELHDRVLNPGELEGLAGSKSLEGALSRIDFRISYAVIQDEFDLAATYAVAIAQGHVFNDANKRTAHAAMELCLYMHDVHIGFTTEEVGDLIIKVAQGLVDEGELGTWLRTKKIKALEEELRKKG